MKCLRKRLLQLVLYRHCKTIIQKDWYKHSRLDYTAVRKASSVYFLKIQSWSSLLCRPALYTMQNAKPLPIPFLRFECIICIIRIHEEDEELSSNPSLPLRGCCSYIGNGVPREPDLPPQHPLAVISSESAGPI